jgi:hypothetical protein
MTNRFRYKKPTKNPYKTQKTIKNWKNIYKKPLKTIKNQNPLDDTITEHPLETAKKPSLKPTKTLKKPSKSH